MIGYELVVVYEGWGNNPLHRMAVGDPFHSRDPALRVGRAMVKSEERIIDFEVNPVICQINPTRTKLIKVANEGWEE